MLFTRFFLGNPRFSLVTFVFLLAMGAQALRTISVSEDPALEIPRYDILAVAPGLSPEDLEALVVRPLEDAMLRLENVKHVTASIHDSVAQLSVEFEFGSDTQRKYDDVLRETNQMRARLPSTLTRLDVLRGRTENVAIMQIALVAPAGADARQEEIAENFRRRIEHVEGVGDAGKHAFTGRELHVTLNIEKLTQHRITVPGIIAAILSSNSVVPGGTVEIEGRHLSVTTVRGGDAADAIGRLPLAPQADGTGFVHLHDVATVGWDHEEGTVFGRFNGEPAIFLTAMMQKGRNIITVSRSVRAVLDEFRKELPPGMRLEVGFDQSLNVARRMSHLGRDFLIALLLVLITLSPLGFRPSIIVIISIPLCLALGLAALQWCGFGLNQFSIVGCIIALGLLVDDSIVVTENITRFRREGHSPMEAARLATKQIFVAVIGTTATLLLAFLPLLMLPEAAGLFIRSLPAAVVFAVLASLLVALTIVPWLASLLLTGSPSAEGNRVLQLLQGAIAAFYRPVLRWCMRRRTMTLVFAALLCAGSLALVPTIGFSLFPKADIPQFLVEIDAGENTTLANTDRIARETEEILRHEPEVKSLFTTVGQGNPRVYYNVFQTGRKIGTAAILVGLKSYDPQQTPNLIGRLRTQLDQIAGARVEIREFQNGPPVSAPIEVRVMGEDLKSMSLVAADVARLLRDTDGTRAVDNPARNERMDVTARFDEDKLAALGLDRTGAQQMVRLVFAGLEAGTLHDRAGVECAIRICLPRAESTDLDGWDETRIPARGGQELKLKDFAMLELSRGPASIERRGRERVVTVTAQVKEGWNVERVTEDLRRRLPNLKIPADCRFQMGGEVESRMESFAGFGSAILLAVFGCLAILVLEFRTFRGMLIVASVIPLGIIGGLAGLWITGFNLSFMAMVGFIALIGIEIKNSILLVDFTNQLRARGMSVDDAVAQAGEVRFLPVVLTTLTALGALVPLAMERSALYSPLAVVIMGGSLSSLLLSRLVTPVLYRVLSPGAGIRQAPTG